MSKRNPQNATRRMTGSPIAEPRRVGALAMLLFWPFFLVNALTRGFSWPTKLLLRGIGYPLVYGLATLALLALVYGLRARSYDLSRIHAMPARCLILDRQGNEIGRIHGEKRYIVPLKDVSENFRKAIIAREDERFYRHGAFDTIGIGRAVLNNLKGKREGASTITQQLSSDIYGLKSAERKSRFLRVRQIDRKFLEIAIAMRMESSMTKDEILEAYINQINWGQQIRGVGEASRIYFEKHPAELELSEAALLAGIVRGPDSFNPFRSMEAATRERNTTLARMVAAKAITQAEADEAKKDAIEIRPKVRRAAKYSYALDAIRRDLDVILDREDLDLGGLEIVTTIDLRIQETAEEALEKHLAATERRAGYAHTTRPAWQKLPEHSREDPNYIQGACVVIENQTGGVVAIVGGRDARESRFNRAQDSQRQIGSIFKPFVYLSAFDRGMSPYANVDDGPIRPGEIQGAGTWRPHNSDGTFGGMTPVSVGLTRSRNTMSVRVGNYAGLEKVRNVANMSGFTGDIPANPTSYLGSWGATPMEVATAYTIFPNEGRRFTPLLVSQIRDRDGNVLYSNAPRSYQATSSRSAWSVSRILRDVTRHGTASAVTRLGFTKACGGKTGTTNAYKDAWFAGYTSSLTCAVWVGMDRPQTTFKGGYGSTLALPIWVDIMKTADRLGYKAGRLNENTRMVKADLCRLSRKRATAGCHEAGTASDEAVPADLVPEENDFCPIHPAKAAAVIEESGDPESSAPSQKPMRALPADEDEVDMEPRALRALPVEE